MPSSDPTTHDAPTVKVPRTKYDKQQDLQKAFVFSWVERVVIVKIQIIAEGSLKKLQGFGISAPVACAIVPNAPFGHFPSENITEKGVDVTDITI